MFLCFLSCPAFVFCWTDLDVRQTDIDILFRSVFSMFSMYLGMPKVAYERPESVIFFRLRSKLTALPFFLPFLCFIAKSRYFFILEPFSLPNLFLCFFLIFYFILISIASSCWFPPPLFINESGHVYTAPSPFCFRRLWGVLCCQ
jgi:hypothetical protein